jgi:DNA modification methylase
MKTKFISSVWDFSQPTLEYFQPIHDYFRWLGKLPPPLVRRLIKLYSTENELILANFAGSGTVLIEANLARRRSIGIDSNPLSYLICKVKTSPFIPPRLDNFISKIRGRLQKSEKRLLFKFQGAEKWFYEESLIDLELILDEINKLEDEKEKNFFLLALANIVWDASKVDSRCVNHIVLDKNKPKINVFEEFCSSIRKLENALREFQNSFNKNIQTDVFLGDARQLDFLSNNSVDLVISHPPYLGQILYYNIYRLVNDLLGFHYHKVRKTDISTNSFNDYMVNMKKVFNEMFRVLKPYKHACVIIGDTRKDGGIVPTFSYFIDYANKTGFKLIDIFIWILSRKAGMNVARRGNYVDHNYILVFQKKG